MSPNWRRSALSRRRKAPTSGHDVAEPGELAGGQGAGQLPVCLGTATEQQVAGDHGHQPAQVGEPIAHDHRAQAAQLLQVALHEPGEVPRGDLEAPGPETQHLGGLEPDHPGRVARLEARVATDEDPPAGPVGDHAGARVKPPQKRARSTTPLAVSATTTERAQPEAPAWARSSSASVAAPSSRSTMRSTGRPRKVVTGGSRGAARAPSPVR